MKKIKVYLQYPWKFPDSPYYKYLVDDPPEKIEYLNIQKQKGVIINKRFFWFSNFLKRNIRRFVNLFELSLPNAHLSPKRDYDLIHCCHCLSKNKDMPWIADIESEWQLYVGKKTKKVKNKIREILLKKNCKKIMPWTNATAREIIKEFPEIENKIEVVYPAIPLPKIKRKKHKGINLLFVARYFYEKGGVHALKVIDKLTKNHKNVNGIMVSEVPESIKQKYSKNERIKFYDLMPQKELFQEIMTISDVFIYPGYSDSFGFSFLESLSIGIPIVSIDSFNRKEIITNNKTGFIIKNYGIKWNKNIPILNKEDLMIEEMVRKTELLIKNKKLREKMSENCINEIKNGKFSIERRNRQLKKIYGGALR